MKLEHDPKAYAACMQEIKNRVGILDQALQPWRSNGTVSVANTELALLQMRKCYELIAFSSPAANRPRFERTWRKYQKEWRLDRIVKSIARHNPECMPVAIREKEHHEPGIRAHIERMSAPKMTIQKLLKRHGQIGRLMHAANPFGGKYDFKDELLRITKERDELIHLLDLHLTVIYPNSVYYRVAMNAGKPGDIQVAVMASTS